MESLLGADFRQVKLVIDPWAADLGARAYTKGELIAFAPGAFQPNTAAGRALLAHELKHVLQQREGRVTNPFPGGLSIVDDPLLEYEAECVEATTAGAQQPTLDTRVARFARCLDKPGEGVMQCAWTDTDAGNRSRHKWTNMGADNYTSQAPDGWYIYYGNHLFKREGTDDYFDYTPSSMVLKAKGRLSTRVVLTPQAFERPAMHSAGKGPAYGLQQAEKLTIQFNTFTNTGTVIKQPRGTGPVVLGYSTEIKFNIPAFITADGTPLYPHKYEFVSGDVLYFMATPPERVDTFYNDSTPMTRKGQQQELSTLWLTLYDIEGRKRFPDQVSVMGEGPVAHVSRFLGRELDSRSWHWCHLIAHSMRPDSIAQVQDNLVCGTAGCNGDMINLEAAVKSYVKKHNLSVMVTVVADVIEGWHIATRMCYSISRTRGSVNFYLEPLSPNRSIGGDYDVILRKLESELGTT